jgi:ferrous iron transport protein B
MRCARRWRERSVARRPASRRPPNLAREARRIATAAIVSEAPVRRWTHLLDRFLLHPIAGVVILAVVMFAMFQAVFAWSETPIGWIESGVSAVGTLVTDLLPEGVLRSLLVDGVIGGVGAVVVFLPQILILFLFILLLEGTATWSAPPS